MNLSLLKMQNSSTKNIKMFALPAIILLLSSLYLIFAWFRYVDIAADEALKLVQSLESIFHPEHIAELTGSAEDIEKPEYILTKNSLVKLVENTPSIHNAYFLVERNGRLIFLLDTEPYDSPYFVSPGQIFEEADSMYLKPFKTGETVLTEPMSDRWGRWISALVPVRDPSDQNIISVLGIDFSASEWYADIRRHMIPDIIIVMSIISICVVYIKTKSTSLALWESERSKSVLLSHLPGLAYRCNYDKDWTMQFVSQGCKDLTGYPAESLLYNKLISYNNIIVPEYREILYNEWKRVLANRLPFKYEYEIITAENERKWVLEMGQGIFDDKGRVEALEGIVLDISDQKKLESYLKYIIEHDSLTGLYNGRFLEETLNRDAKEKCTARSALIEINLSTVHSLTRTYGFHYTEELIKRAADLLSNFQTESRMLFYTYWDRFIFYLNTYKDRNELLGFCTSISKALNELLMTEGISGGIGVVEIDSSMNKDTDELLKKLLLTSEKSINNNDINICPCFYGQDIESEIKREEEIKQVLSRIANDDEGMLYLEYQPILDLKSNEICGFEALARLRTENLGNVTPLEFIPLAEETKLIIPIGQRIVRKALYFLKKLEDAGYKTLSVSINVSVIEILSNDFVENLFAAIHEMQVSPENIGIELTESVFMDNFNEVNNKLKKLRKAGINVAIDDFGTGYSSLARERELDVNILKIDKHFIDKLRVTHPENAITCDIISMAHKLGHLAVAEGVEEKRQFIYLKEWECDRIQGYFISKPLSEEGVLEFLREYREVRSLTL